MLVISITGCGVETDSSSINQADTTEKETSTEATIETTNEVPESVDDFVIPDYSGKPSIPVNNNQPQFDDSLKTTESFEEYVRVLANRNPYLVQYGFKKYQYKFLIDLLKASEAARLNWESFLESDGTNFEEYKKAHYSEGMILYDETYNDVKLPEEDAVEECYDQQRLSSGAYV